MNEASGCGLYPGPGQHQRLNKTDYGNAIWHLLHPHRTDERNSTTQANTMISNSLKAQGKGVLHPMLTEVSLRIEWTPPACHEVFIGETVEAKLPSQAENGVHDEYLNDCN